ncbi:MAG: hypothetical protein NVSMB31_00220 [Vulcanimicrobiaceae bacterium]
MGESFHPGGIDLTLELAGALGLDAASRVLDVACGKGTSAFAIAEQFGCYVTGVDLSAANVAEANVESEERGLSTRVTFALGDAEELGFPSRSFDAILCECALCTFPEKGRAASEFARILRPGGKAGISDLTRTASPLPELDGLLAWIACIADAQPLESYANLLENAGLTIVLRTPRNDALQRMVEQIRGKLFLADVLAGLGKLKLSGLDIENAKHFADAAAKAVRDDKLGYALLVAEKPAM